MVKVVLPAGMTTVVPQPGAAEIALPSASTLVQLEARARDSAVGVPPFQVEVAGMEELSATLIVVASSRDAV